MVFTFHGVFAQNVDEPRTAGTQPAVEDHSDTYRQLDLFGDVFERVRAQYVEETADHELIESAINGMLTALDPHSSYLNNEKFEDMQISTRGEFGGLGIEVTMENGVIKVVSPIDDTPAFRAGVLAGDYIVQIDDEPVMGLTLSEAVDKMRGKVGTEIDLLITRESADAPIEMTLVRDIIKIRSVRHRVEGNSGYVRITTFNQNADSGVKKAIQEIKAELGNKLNGYVLDLRNNPGGLLDQAIAVSDIFLDKGEIVSTRGRHEDDTKRDNATPGDLAEGLPIIVLINGGSASASEIVAGALQDHRRAILLGTQSFGKGSVQTVIPLPGHGAMRLTTARYYTPSGRSIQAKGIEPDILVEPAKIESYNIKRLREENLKGALDRKAVKDDSESTEESEGEDEEVQDYQLMRALDLLNGLMLYKGEPRAVNDNAPAPEAEPSAAETQSQP
ncbi:MAG TPA: S41 family peptidase [Alphaproteobacteria bacterium]|nr:S41 family peptidase [Alphaproteobacteria bacterium]USO06678.1 MAG: S41 family peptidase [Rhodospirillales bacterium]HOO82613.1 S41 family peptidase [Alphaproteobacteria bacterium]